MKLLPNLWGERMSNYEEYLKDSLDRIQSNFTETKTRPIFFIGSGFSRRYIYTPDWKGLLQKLIEDNPEIDKPLQYYIQEYDGDLAAIASQLVNHYHEYAWNNHGNDDIFPSHLFDKQSKNIFLKYKIAFLLENYLDDLNIDTHEYSEELKAFSRLNPQAVITTNYDMLLEELLPKYHPIIGQQIIQSSDTSKIGHILKIHGSIEDLESIIIEKQDYDRFLEKQIYLLAKVFTYFMEHPIVFIGYGLSDENIKSILYNVKQMLDTESEPLIPNMWFVEWSSIPIPESEVPDTQKVISVGNGESVRLNYIKVHTFDELFNCLYQDSLDIDWLQKLEKTVYNVVKSDSITNLEVDIASITDFTDREALLKSLTQNTATSQSSGDEHGASVLPTFVHISDPEQLASGWPLTATELSQRVYEDNTSKWHKAYQLINDVEVKTGVKLRESNNDYYVNLSGTSRFSLAMVELLKKVKDIEPFSIEINGRTLSYPEVEETAINESAATNENEEE